MDMDDEDYKMALRLQQEFENELSQNEPGILCQLSNQRFSAEEIYILDDCAHKFQKTALLKFITESVMTQINVKCPVCPVAVSLRDMTALLPKQPSQAINANGKKGELGIVPTTSSKQASQRITAELKHIMATRRDADGYAVQLVQDNLYLWECTFFGFEPADAIAQDLKKLKITAIVLHVAFPSTYPFAPPFCRVIRPRFQFMTGHVTIGGSICTELLTNKGWTSANTVEAVLVSIRAQFLEGGARLDMNNRSDYTEHEAKDAFNRMVRTHGWH